jgi:hypothetical protein
MGALSEPRAACLIRGRWACAAAPFAPSFHCLSPGKSRSLQIALVLRVVHVGSGMGFVGRAFVSFMFILSFP